jgi:hypothetical protein
MSIQRWCFGVHVIEIEGKNIPRKVIYINLKTFKPETRTVRCIVFFFLDHQNSEQYFFDSSNSVGPTKLGISKHC